MPICTSAVYSRPVFFTIKLILKNQTLHVSWQRYVIYAVGIYAAPHAALPHCHTWLCFVFNVMPCCLSLLKNSYDMFVCAQ